MPSINWRLGFDFPLLREMPYSTSLLTSTVKRDPRNLFRSIEPYCTFYHTHLLLHLHTPNMIFPNKTRWDVNAQILNWISSTQNNISFSGNRDNLKFKWVVMDGSGQVDMLYLHFSKAFDRVSHRLLIHTLQSQFCLWYYIMASWTHNLSIFKFSNVKVNSKPVQVRKMG